MNCPNCGLNLQGVTSATCPRCGQPIATANPYGQPPAGYPQPNYPQPGYPPAPPGYNQAGPTGYEQPAYGQPAGYGPPAGYGMPLPPPPPAPKRRASSRTVRVIAVVTVLACVGIVVLIGALGNRVTQSPLPGVTATVTGKWIYRQTFTSSTDTIATDNNCSFKNGGYQVQNGFNCYTSLDDQTNATITVQTKQTSGDGSGYCWIAFRRASTGSAYTFGVDANGGWSVYKFVSGNGDPINTPGTNQAIQPGANAVNTLQVHMTGSHFDFFVNGVNVGSVDDASYAKGKVGLGADSNTTCVFNNMEVTV